MKLLSAFVLACVAAGPSTAKAQNPVQSVFTACPNPARVFRATEVQVTAHFMSDSTRSPRPSVADRQSPNVVQFVVDTLGVPDLGTLKWIRVTDSLLVRQAAATIGAWRYRPAIATACKVRQLVLTGVVR